MNIFLYISCILIWGTSWIAIHMQLGDVSILASVFYRFAIAASIFLVFLIVFKKIQKTSLTDHAWFAGQSLCFFSLNFLFFYHATKYIPSGIVAIIFSTVLLFNSINRWVFFHDKTSKSEFIGICVGVVGLSFLFWRELMQQNIGFNFIKGMLFSFIGTLIFSIGNVVSIRISTKGISPITSNAYSMAYGAFVLLCILLITDTPLTLDFSISYVFSLFYLSVFSSIFGFTIYLVLINRIGLNKTAYCMVVFPIVSILMSTIFESYRWDLTTYLGVLVIILGNFLMVYKDCR